MTKRRLIVTNGVFDCFHDGHRAFLKRIRELFPDDPLLVLINSDESTRRLKGEGRPRDPDWQRLNTVGEFIGAWPFKKPSMSRCFIFTNDTPVIDIQHQIDQGYDVTVIKGRGYKTEDVIAPSGCEVLVLSEPDLGISTTSILSA